ncbi:hypothetical protein [Phenylobacterium sp. SCN 70-31]|uniref:hypothetical protein n=1 Tax=Phenylobacterium sp. SCN 70-31 TaxID=1660129 RepID=UPI0025F364FA|nr:hypothetical protein [Phenylobacterium sp. SCN 70-31]
MGLDIVVDGELPSPTFRFRHDGLFKPTAKFSGQLSVGLADPQQDGSPVGPDPLWRIETTEAAARLEIRYGETPPGAREVRAPEPLRVDELYVVVVSGGGRIGGVHFAQVGGRLMVSRDRDTARVELERLLAGPQA